MSEVLLAKTAGFCFGVRRAVKLAEEAARAGEASPCLTLGPIIHNRHVVERLSNMGITTISSPEEAGAGDRVIIRCHGVNQKDLEILRAKGASIIDATCPDAKKIHHIIQAAVQEKRQVIIVGEKDHPEVLAAAGWCKNPVIVSTPEELEDWIILDERRHMALTVVFQTTGDRGNMKASRQILKKWCTSVQIFDTICDATSKRQEEAADLAERCDIMVVIGDKSSANSRNLAAICKRRSDRVVFIEGRGELDPSQFDEADTIGITAGASTPAWIIKEVYQTMSDEILKSDQEPEMTPVQPEEEVVESVPTEEAAAPPASPVEEMAAEPDSVAEEAPEVSEPVVEEAVAEPDSVVEEAVVEPASETEEEPAVQEEESFEALLEKSIKTLHTGEKVVGIVAAITPTEVTVDLGTKQSGYIPHGELTDDADAKIEDLVQIGGEVEAYVMRVNDVEGTVMLSKKRLDTVRYWDEIDRARGERLVLDGVVTEENKGGVVVRVKGVRVFVPASQTGIPKDQPMAPLVGQKVKLRITEMNQSRRRVVGSIRMAAAEERKAKAGKVWAEIENGKRYTGTVKSFTSYGAFVDIGGVDGMVHVSALSWGRIKSPSDVVKVGDEIEVYVISFDKEKGKISLGHKDPALNPWNTFTEKYEKGSVARVRVVKLMPFGAFAEIVPGVDGLIHISQIADRRIGKPNEFLSEGQEIDVQIIAIDYDKKNVSLSIRALIEDLKGPPAEREHEEEDEEAGGGDAIVYDTDVNKPEPEEAEEEPVAEEPVVEEAAEESEEAQKEEEAGA